MYSPILVTPPSEAPVSVAAVKAALGIAGNADDSQIERLIGVAVSYLDAWTGVLGGRCLMPQVWRQDFDAFATEFRIPMIPIREIVSIEYDDENGDVQSVDADQFSLRQTPCGAIVRMRNGFSFPSLSTEKPAVHVTFAAGYADANQVPQVLRHAIIMMVNRLRHEQETNPMLVGETIDGVVSLRYREGVPAMADDTVKNLIRPFVVPQIG